MSALRTAFTSLQERWLLESIGVVPRAEERTTCAECPMVPPHPSGEGFIDRYDPRVKCCTYTPNLRNFIVGAIIADEAIAEGRERVLGCLAARQGLTPLGLHAPPRVTRSELPEGAWGRDVTLKCPFAVGDEDPGCGLWPHRNAVCATWFCLHRRGMRGRRAWRDIQRFLSQVENVLAIDCMLAMGAGPAAVRLLDAEGGTLGPDDRSLRGAVKADGTIDERLSSQLWGPWLGREVDYYLSCRSWVSGLPFDRIAAAGGVTLALLRQRAQDASRELASFTLPARIACCRIDVECVWTEASDGCLWYAHRESQCDPLRISPAVRAALDFAGTLTPGGLVDRLREHGEVAATEDTVRSLFDWGLLVSEEEAPRRLGRKVRPDDALRVAPGAALLHEMSFDDAGRPTVCLRIGAVAVDFDEPALLNLGHALEKNQHGFRAVALCGWTTSHTPLTWERAAEILDALLDVGVIEPVDD